MARAFTTGQSLNAADNAANQISGTAMTIAFWVYMTSTAAESFVVHKGLSSTGEINYAVRLFDWYDSLGHNRVIWEFEDGGFVPDRVFSNAGSRLAINTWNHVACVKNGTGTTAMAIYINGALDVNGTSNQSLSVRNRPLALGAAWNGTSYVSPLAGRLAEVGIWDFALSVDEIGGLAKGYAPIFYRRANLRAYYPLIGRRSPEPDEARNINATVTGATYADHPPRAVYPIAPELGMGTTAPPPAPVANFSATPLSGVAPLTVNFTDSSTNTPTGWAWDFENNGSTDSTTQNPSRVYSTAGTYTVKLTATNAGGSDDEIKTGYITVSAAPPPAPVANFNVTPTSGNAPLTVTFTDTSSNTPTSWAWDFQNNGSTDSTSQNPTHIYSTAGTYTVKLTATNAGGSDDEIKTNHITVTSPPPPPPVATQIARVYVDWNNDGDYSDANEEITNYVINLRWNVGFRKAHMTVADETDCEIVLNNVSKLFSPENASSALYGLMQPQRRIRITLYDGSVETTMYTGWIDMIQPMPGERGERKTLITGVGAKKFLQDAKVYLPLLTNIRTDEVIRLILQQVQMPPAAGQGWILGAEGYGNLSVTTRLPAALGALNAGIITLSYVGDTWNDKTSAYEALYSVVNAEQGRFFFNRNGEAVFWNRQYAQMTPALSATLTDQQMNLEYEFGADMFNQIEVTLTPRSVSPTNSDVLFSLDSPISLDAEETRVQRFNYIAEDGEEVSGQEVTLGSVISSGTAFAGAISASARSAEVTLFGGSSGGTINTLIILGRRYRSHKREVIKALDGVSIALYGRRVKQINAELLDDRDAALSIANHELASFRDAMGTVTRLTLLNRNATYKTWQRTWSVGTRIRVIESQTAHDSDYLIVGEEHQVTEGLTLHETRYTLERVSREKAWVLGQVGSSEMSVTTKLGY